MKTQLTRLHFLEPLICRSRMELTICIFNKLLDGADAASQWTTLWELEQLLSGMRETKRIRGKKGHHRENRKPLKREGAFQRQNSHVPQELPWLRICHQTTLIPAADCLLPFRLLLGTSYSCRLYTTPAVGLGPQAASLQICSPVTSVPLLALNSICWRSPSLAQTSSDSKTPTSSCLPDVSLWWITGISN